MKQAACWDGLGSTSTLERLPSPFSAGLSDSAMEET